MLDKKNIMTDFEYFAPAFLKIKLETGDIVPFRFNSTQIKVLETIKKELKVDRLTIDIIMNPYFVLRVFILKARQQGISTLFQAIIFWINYLLKNMKALTMGHKTEASNNLFDMFKRFDDNLPRRMKRAIERSNEKKIQYLKTKSENKIDTAGAGEIGRSDTLQEIHLTEVGFYPDLKTTFVGVMQGAKYAKLHVIESTANGFNLFKNKWDDCVAGKLKYIPIFLSWLEFPEYIIESKARRFIKDLTTEEEEEFIKDLGNVLYNEYEGEEKLLIEKYGATIDQLQFRRHAIDNLCEGDINRFHQEYPRDPEEAFISSGSNVFNRGKIEINAANCREPIKRGDLIYNYNGSGEIEGVEFVENKRGYISIWTEPGKVDGRNRFASGWDVAEGLEQGDFSDGAILDRLSNEVYMTWHGHIDPDLLGEEQHKIYLFLNKDIYFCTEKNNNGLTTITKAFKLRLPMYTRENFNKGYETRSAGDFGHITSDKTRRRLVNLEAKAIREDSFKDYDLEYWKECRTFVRNPRGKPEAEGKGKDPGVKNFDDRIFSRGLMIICDEWMPVFTKFKKREPVARSYINKKPKGITRF